MKHFERRGFSLLTTTLIVAVAALAGVVVLDAVTNDQTLRGIERRSQEAAEVAEGGAMAILNDQRLADALPDPAGQDLTARVDLDGAFAAERSDGLLRAHEAEVSLLRVVPVLESSHSRVRAVVYDLEVTGRASGHAAEVESQIYKMASTAPGVVREQRHAW
jgi:hypothetical protein